MKTTLIGDNENKTETLDSVPNFQRGDKTKYTSSMPPRNALKKRLRWKEKTTNGFTPGKLLSPFSSTGKKRGSSNRKPRSLDGGQDSGICSNVWEDGKTLAALKRVFFRVALSSVVGDDRRVRALANSKFRVPR